MFIEIKTANVKKLRRISSSTTCTIVKTAIRRKLIAEENQSRKYKCDYCNLSFYYKSSLLSHRLIHSGKFFTIVSCTYIYWFLIVPHVTSRLNQASPVDQICLHMRVLLNCVRSITHRIYSAEYYTV